MNEKYQAVHITIKLSSESNRLLSEAAKRSHRRKVAEARLRIEDHLFRFRSIAELKISPEGN